MIFIVGYIYKTTNLVNKKVYIGKHLSNKYDKTYFGSGKILLKAIDKYGKSNFDNVILDTADTIEELNNKEKYYIKIYKERYQRNCYNIASGGEGGNTLLYKTIEEKRNFVEKMTIINKRRCATEKFKSAISKASKKRYENEQNRIAQSKVQKAIWENQELRVAQSKRLKSFYGGKGKDCSFNYKKCCFELEHKKIEFNSIKELREFLINEYKYNPDRRTFNSLINSKVPYVPFHKNNTKLQRLKGMVIYKLEEDVETKGDECSPVGVGISATSKCETI